MKSVSGLLASTITTQVILLLYLLVSHREWGFPGSALGVALTLSGAVSVVLLLLLLRSHHRHKAILHKWEEGLEKVSHDFRTPVGYIAILAQKKGMGEQDAWNLVQRNAEWMLLLLERQLDLRATKKGRLLLHKESVSLAVVVADVTAVFNVLGNSPTPRILVEGNPGCHVLVDSVRLKQVLFNLVENAVKYSHGEISVSWEEAPGGRVSVTVRDEGPGLPKGFDGKFLNGTSGQTPPWVLGRGVGLKLVSEILSAHGTELRRVPSERGTVWAWELPAAETPAPVEWEKRPKVVLVDDDPVYARLFSEHVKDVADVLPLLRGNEILPQLRNLTAPDLILVDYHLNGVNGTEVLEAVRSQFGSKRPKMVLMSHSSAESLGGIPRGQSQDATIVKPITPAEIKATIRRLLR